MLHITSINFKNYKSFKHFSIALNEFNILVGPNNAGKSTIIGSLKLLAEGIRMARAKKPIRIKGPDGIQVFGYQIDLTEVPVAIENVFCDYNDTEPAIIRFRISNGSYLQVFFPEQGLCFMTCESSKIIDSPRLFKEEFDIEIGYVPILGPVEHVEPLYLKEAARLALLSHRASRNFRNIWYHFGEDFDDFRNLIKSTWPGMDIDKPEINRTGEKSVINMFCPEDRIPREIFWAGFGFQVWCQMLTYVIKNKKATIFIVDEPDIYLHSELQRQLLGLLKNLGPDIIIATHSTEIISEAEVNDILVVNKAAKSGKRIKDPSELQRIFQTLGSNLNPILTQIAKSKRVLFVEGKDFLIFSKLARRISLDHVANRTDFAVVPVEGFNPVKLKAFKEGIEKTIGAKIVSAVIFDRDYRSDSEVEYEEKELLKENLFARIHSLKELENFLLVPTAIKAAIDHKVEESNARTGNAVKFTEDVTKLLMQLSEDFKHKVQAQLQTHRQKFEKQVNPKLDNSTILEKILSDFDKMWNEPTNRLKMIPGKEFLSTVNQYLQDHYSIGLSYSGIINNMNSTNFPTELKELLNQIDALRRSPIPS